ncbi:hypothetical protein BD289DRAFT_421155 [Coniella lustricola]|uniref:Uncharacterized protein n=1 Tax=Coniella lustricola TaxID=2025994 RepID=A0A2T3AM56_9PEZI|nr:hypothetical protein BD289DRAFT_421155 [Coniella lustricola]
MQLPSCLLVGMASRSFRLFAAHPRPLHVVRPSLKLPASPAKSSQPVGFSIPAALIRGGKQNNTIQHLCILQSSKPVPLPWTQPSNQQLCWRPNAKRLEPTFCTHPAASLVEPPGANHQRLCWDRCCADQVRTWVLQGLAARIDHQRFSNL